MAVRGTKHASPYDGLAKRYSRARPSYPPDSIAHLRVGAGDIVADIGAGTGIFTRQLAASLAEARVVGVEASEDMYREAQRISAGIPNVSFIQGTAEALPFDDNSVRILTAATAIHWFDRPTFYDEAIRCLRPDGELLAFQNIRRWWESAFLADYESLHEAAVAHYHRGRYPARHGGYDELDVAHELRARTDFGNIQVSDIIWSQQMSVDEFIDLSLSSSITQRAIAAMGDQAYLEALRKLLERHATSKNLAEISYLTRVTSAKPVADSKKSERSASTPRSIHVSHSPIRIIQISDPHLSARRPFFQHNWEILLDLLNDEAPDLIVCTGDMTIDGADVPSELAFASRQFERISSPVLFVPGNHDIGNSLPDVRGGETVISEERRRAYRQLFGNDCWFRDIGPSWRLVGLDSMLFGSGIAGDEQQWDMLEEAIRTAADRSVMIFQHKPLYHRAPDETVPTQSAIYPEHRARLRKVLSDARRLVVCSGHIHHYRTARWGRIAQIWAPSTSFTISISGQKRPRGARRVGYLRHVLDGAASRHEFIEPCQFINMDLGNWGNDPRGFHARYGTEQLRGLVLEEPTRFEAVEPSLRETGSEGIYSAGATRSATGS
jgi:SAM-dependent methyltransferase/Icc-related predicted phosphoesterase